MTFNRSNPPKETGEIHFTLPEIKHLKTENGMEVLYVQKNNLPIVQLNLIVNAGSYFDPKGKFGLAKLTGMMIDEGAGGLSALELDNEIDSLGSILEISNDHDSTYVTMLAMKENFQKSLDLFSKIISEPHFDKSDFEREQHKAIVRTIQYMDDPSYIASTEFERIIFEGTGYQNPVPGTEESIKNISLEDVKSFHKNYFNLNNSVLILIGNIEENILMEKLNHSLKYYPSNISHHPETGKYSFSNKIYLYHKEGATQSEIRVGSPSSRRKENNYFARLLLNSILGGQFSSRINLNLREDKGYTYGAHSAFSYTKKTGHFEVSTSVQTEYTANSMAEIYNEIKKIKDGITEDELNFAKSYLIKKFPAMFETYGQIARNLNTKVVFSLADDYFNNYIENLAKQSIDELIQSAKDELIDSNMTTVVVGDKNIVKKQIEDKFDLEIIEI